MHTDTTAVPTQSSNKIVWNEVKGDEGLSEPSHARNKMNFLANAVKLGKFGKYEAVSQKVSRH